ncbi:hypothetical protein KP509_12G049800 [Ceratopteris richardii]|uniref:Uncharacterized protein n=1 Tax=Ceratopteris richardii TaxID=49495 RepID=A0A8T2TPG7_CERRI|nr:hypothetical protein KP509_12G049800 [Ceratopteris richardii]
MAYHVSILVACTSLGLFGVVALCAVAEGNIQAVSGYGNVFGFGSGRKGGGFGKGGRFGRGPGFGRGGRFGYDDGYGSGYRDYKVDVIGVFVGQAVDEGKQFTDGQETVTKADQNPLENQKSVSPVGADPFSRESAQRSKPIESEPQQQFRKKEQTPDLAVEESNHVDIERASQVADLSDKSRNATHDHANRVAEPSKVSPQKLGSQKANIP